MHNKTARSSRFAIELRLKGLLAALTKREDLAVLLCINCGFGHGVNRN
jgi:hypothetical protein